MYVLFGKSFLLYVTFHLYLLWFLLRFPTYLYLPTKYFSDFNYLLYKKTPVVLIVIFFLYNKCMLQFNRYTSIIGPGVPTCRYVGILWGIRLYRLIPNTGHKPGRSMPFLSAEPFLHLNYYCPPHGHPIIPFSCLFQKSPVQEKIALFKQSQSRGVDPSQLGDLEYGR